MKSKEFGSGGGRGRAGAGAHPSCALRSAIKDWALLSNPVAIIFLQNKQIFI